MRQNDLNARINVCHNDTCEKAVQYNLILPFGIASSHQLNNFLIGCVAIDTIVLNLHNIYVHSCVLYTIHVNKMKSNEK